MFMKPKNKLKRKNTHVFHKTKDAFVNDFVRWSKEKRALKKQTPEKQIDKTRRDSAQALMVWADDGGAFVKNQPVIKQ